MVFIFAVSVFSKLLWNLVDCRYQDSISVDQPILSNPQN